jgi:hypothetical protein
MITNCSQRLDDIEYCCQVCNIADEDVKCSECFRYVCLSPECCVALPVSKKLCSIVCTICFDLISNKLEQIVYDSE